MIFFIDIVLNHTSGDSEWIKEYPESTYNTENCPYLTVAWVLDKALTDYDIKLSKETTEDNDIKTDEDVNKVMSHIEFKIIRPLRLFEFFYIDTDTIPDTKEISAIVSILKDSQPEDIEDKKNQNLDQFMDNNATGEGEKRYGVKIDYEKILDFLVVQYPDKDTEFYLQKLIELYNSRNMRAFNMASGFIDEAIGAIKGEIHYKKVQQLEHQRVRPGKRVLTSYFRELDNPQKTKCVHNGWSMAGDASKQDF